MKDQPQETLLIRALKIYQPVITSWPAAYLWVEVIPKMNGEWWNIPLGLTAFAVSATAAALWGRYLIKLLGL